MDKYDVLKLENQLCFPLYACSKEIVRMYRPFLDDLDLTYTQYVAMMALWEKNELSVKELGSMIYLDSGTLTPLLKSMERKGYLTRKRNAEDERVVMINLTDKGRQLRDKALTVPERMRECVPLSAGDSADLYKLLHKLLDSLEGENNDVK